MSYAFTETSRLPTTTNDIVEAVREAVNVLRAHYTSEKEREDALQLLRDLGVPKVENAVARLRNRESVGPLTDPLLAAKGLPLSEQGGVESRLANMRVVVVSAKVMPSGNWEIWAHAADTSARAGAEPASPPAVLGGPEEFRAWVAHQDDGRPLVIAGLAVSHGNGSAELAAEEISLRSRARVTAYDLAALSQRLFQKTPAAVLADSENLGRIFLKGQAPREEELREAAHSVAALPGSDTRLGRDLAAKVALLARWGSAGARTYFAQALALNYAFGAVPGRLHAFGEHACDLTLDPVTPVPASWHARHARARS